jgi:hypothetical protein
MNSNYIAKGFAVTLLQIARFSVLSLAMVLSIGWAQAQTAKPTVVLHRDGAGELDADGWTNAKSTNGKYSVDLPTKFKDFTATHDDPKSPIAQAYGLSARMMQPIRFTTSRMHFRGGKDAARKQFEQIKAAAGKRPYKTVKPMRMNDYEALEAELEVKKGRAIQRTVLLDEDLFTIIMEYANTEEAAAMRLAPRFFKSVSFE